MADETQGTTTTAATEAPPAEPTQATPPAETAPETPAGDQGLKWFDLLREDLRKSPALAKYKDVDALAEGYVNLEKKLGERPQGVMPLPENATPEQIAEYRKGMGIPESPDQYNFEMPQYPEDAPLTPEDQKWWKETAHKYNLTPAQVKGVLESHAGLIAQRYDAANAEYLTQQSEQRQVLQRKYGAMAENILRIAREHVKRTFGDEAFAQLDQTLFKTPTGQYMMLSDSPVLIEILAENARLKGHDKFVQQDPQTGAFLTPETAQLQLNQAYQDRRAGKLTDEQLKSTIERLGPLAYPSRPRS